MIEAIREIMAEANIPALSLAVIEDGRIVSTYASGPGISPQTRFQVCCLGKPVTAHALLLLQQEGRLHLDDPVCRYLPFSWLPQPAAVAAALSIRHLLSHTGGVIRGSFQQRTRTADEYAHEAHESTFAYPPGTQFKFSNLGYSLCGAIVEAVAQTPFTEFVTERIFRPLGMNSVAFTRPLDAPAGYSRGEYYALMHSDDLLQAAPEFPLPAAAGGFYCSAEDYARFLVAVLDGLSPGLGFEARASNAGILLRHTGSNSGYSALAVANLQRRCGAVAFSNRANASPDLERILHVATSGRAVLEPAFALDSFAGDFVSPSHTGPGDALRIRPNCRGLVAELGKSAFALRRKGRKSFIAETGPLREYVLRFSFRDSAPRACSAGAHFFSTDADAEPPSPPQSSSKVIGRYACPPYATAEIFVRCKHLYCLCSPLHEARLVPVAPDTYTQTSGLFKGEPLRISRSAGRITALSLGGMSFARLEH